MIDVVGNGQARTPYPGEPPSTGWAGVWSCPGTGAVTIANTIMIGLTAMNANPLWPNAIPFTVKTNPAGVNNTMTNCILEAGQYGYLLSKTGGTFSGNRTYANVALTAADFDT
jgi:hypothetical protein